MKKTLLIFSCCFCISVLDTTCSLDVDHETRSKIFQDKDYTENDDEQIQEELNDDNDEIKDEEKKKSKKNKTEKKIKTRRSHPRHFAAGSPALERAE